MTPIDDQAMGTAMLYSSGTTGKPKGVFNPPLNDLFDEPLPLTLSLGAAFGFGSETTYLSPAPLYHAAPLHYNLVVLDSGGTSIIMEKFDAVRSLELIEEHRVTHSQWVPHVCSYAQVARGRARKIRYQFHAGGDPRRCTVPD